MAAYLVGVDRVMDVADGGAAFTRRTQFGVLVDGEVGGGLVFRQPARHRGGGRLRHIQVFQRERVDALGQQADDGVGFRGRAGVDDQPALDRVDPEADIVVLRQGRGQLLVNDRVADLLQLLLARLVALLMFDFQGACRRGLGDRLARQQLGLYAQGQQQLAADRMRQVRTLAGRHPANGLPLQLAGGHIGMPLQRFVQALQVPEGRGGLDPVDLGVLEHGGPLFRRGHAAARGALLGGGQGQAQLLVQLGQPVTFAVVCNARQVIGRHVQNVDGLRRAQLLFHLDRVQAFVGVFIMRARLDSRICCSRGG
ncbi:hypothetical protein G6F22_014616 [Rhizopus arrhizus]|nr:hypothetical protein G6F22_014616 [Rhizopus arrhizus]